jgi:DNA modification methylase
VKLVTIHPFPARMASEIAIEHLRKLPKTALVSDPMCGSGTVLRTCAEMGIRAVGCDLDPLAVLMSRVWTRPLTTSRIELYLNDFLKRYEALASDDIYLPWIDDCEETTAFIDLWFESKQKQDLRKLAWLLAPAVGPISDLLRVALSGIIITKERGASIARDTSHSRPHRWFIDNDYDVLKGFRDQTRRMISRLASEKILTRSVVKRADARSLAHMSDGEVDMILTSPPYLNMIDYMRGHRLALVWLGYSISSLRNIRSKGIGSEIRASESSKLTDKWLGVAADGAEALTSREYGMLQRYASDLATSLAEQARTLKPGGKLVSVVGNSRLRGVYIENSTLTRLAAVNSGLRLRTSVTRELPEASRYLPISSKIGAAGSLNKRMREEVVMTFTKH